MPALQRVDVSASHVFHVADSFGCGSCGCDRGDVRNAVLDVNIRVLSRRDVETDHDTAFRAICYLAIAGIALVSLFVPFGTAGCLTAASACLIVAPSAIRSAVGKFRILSDRHDLSKTVSSILADDSNASGERR